MLPVIGSTCMPTLVTMVLLEVNSRITLPH
jgi:hypothetical protein